MKFNLRLRLTCWAFSNSKPFVSFALKRVKTSLSFALKKEKKIPCDVLLCCCETESLVKLFCPFFFPKMRVWEFSINLAENQNGCKWRGRSTLTCTHKKHVALSYYYIDERGIFLFLPPVFCLCNDIKSPFFQPRCRCGFSPGFGKISHKLSESLTTFSVTNGLHLLKREEKSHHL